MIWWFALGVIVAYTIAALALRNLFLEGRCWRLRRQLEELGEEPEWDEPHHQQTRPARQRRDGER